MLSFFWKDRVSTYEDQIIEEDDNFRQNFAAFYLDKMQQFKDGFKAIRKRVILKTTLSLVFFISLALIVYLINIKINYINKNEDLFKVLFYLMLLGMILLGYLINKDIRAAQKILIPNLLKFFGSNFNFNQYPNIKIRSYSGYSIFPTGVDEDNNNLITGIYKGCLMKMFHCLLTTGTGKNRRIVFNGMVIENGYRKKFDGKTVLIPNTFNMDLGLAIKNYLEDLEPVELEDPNFMQEFKIYTSDQVMARYILTPAFMERLLKLVDKFGKANVAVSFYNQTILFKINSNFSALGKRLNFLGGNDAFLKNCRKIILQLYIIFELVDDLDIAVDTK